MSEALPLIFSIALGLLVACAVNSPALMPRHMFVERFVKAAQAPGAVDDAPSRVIDRARQRNRAALVVSAVCTGVVALVLPFVNVPSAEGIAGALALAAAVPMLLTKGVLAGREILQAPTGERRVSRGELPKVGDYAPLALAGALFAAQAAFLIAYLTYSLVNQPDARSWVYGWAVISCLVSAVSIVTVVWLLRQPRLASDEAELYWADKLRTDDVVGLLLIGPMCAVIVTVTAFSYGTGATGTPVMPLAAYAFGYIALAAGLAVAIGVVAPRRMRSRLWREGVAA